jgi:hypothetical protein
MMAYRMIKNLAGNSDIPHRLRIELLPGPGIYTKTEDAQNVTEKQCQYNKRTKTRLIHLHGIPS